MTFSAEDELFEEFTSLCELKGHQEDLAEWHEGWLYSRGGATEVDGTPTGGLNYPGNEDTGRIHVSTVGVPRLLEVDDDHGRGRSILLDVSLSDEPEADATAV